MHIHSSACSACSCATSKEMVIAAAEKNYSGIVFTNHFYHGNTAVSRKLSWSDFVNSYEVDYFKAVALGKELNIDVLFGIEEVYEPGKEVLIYGLEPDIFKITPEFKNMNIMQIYNFVNSNGGICVSAHPFRDRDYIPNPDSEPNLNYFDAVEAYNYCNTDEQNQKAFDFAEKNNIKVISGGDVHLSKNFGFAGLAFYERIHNNKALIKALNSSSYKLVINDEII